MARSYRDPEPHWMDQFKPGSGSVFSQPPPAAPINPLVGQAGSLGGLAGAMMGGPSIAPNMAGSLYQAISPEPIQPNTVDEVKDLTPQRREQAAKEATPSQKQKDTGLSLADKLKMGALLTDSLGGLGGSLGYAIGGLSDEECKRQRRGGASLIRDVMNKVVDLSPEFKARNHPGYQPSMDNPIGNPMDPRVAQNRIPTSWNVLSPENFRSSDMNAPGGSQKAIQNDPRFSPSQGPASPIPLGQPSMAKPILLGGTPNQGSSLSSLIGQPGAGAFNQSGVTLGPLGLSDARAKQLEGENAALRTMMDKLTPYSYEYKPEAKAAAANTPIPVPDGRQVGVMAQDLERSALGEQLVKPGPGGYKMVDYSPTVMGPITLAGLADLNKRLNKIEGGRG